MGERLEQFERELLSLLPRLRRFARSLTRDSSEADDLCQVAIERALKQRAQHRPGARLDSWMFTIMRNCWLDEVRSRRRWATHFTSSDDVDHDTSAAAATTSDVLTDMSLQQAMVALPLEQREAVALVWVEGLSYREASDVLDIPVGTLTSRLARARQRLITTLEAA
jgi:RNA polymerase sigma-70 factor (ECF subfamily)